MDEMTFDNLEFQPPVEESEEAEALETNDQETDTQEASSEKPSEETQEITEEKEIEEGETPPSAKVGTVLKVGDKEFDLAKLDNDTFSEVQKMVDDGFLMRADYSKKTAEVARMREEAEGKFKGLEHEREQMTHKITEGLGQMNAEFNQAPLLFLKNSFGYNPDGSQRNPEELTNHINGWINQLVGELKQGDSYNPSALIQQHQYDTRLQKLEREKSDSEQKYLAEEQQKEVSSLTDKIEQRLNSFIKDGTLLGKFSESLPGFKRGAYEKLIANFQSKFEEEFKRSEEMGYEWSDNRFVENYDFGPGVEELSTQLTGTVKDLYGNYISKKKKTALEKSTISGAGTPGRKAGKEPEGGWTFDQL